MKETMALLWLHSSAFMHGALLWGSIIASTVHARNLLMNIAKYAMNILGLSRALMTHDFHLHYVANAGMISMFERCQLTGTNCKAGDFNM